MKLYHNRKDVVSVINKKKAKKGFTLVELLAVIVILAIILVIAVPQIMNTIEESRKGSFESTAKLIASQAERKALENQTLGIEEEIECKDLASLNDIDYESCNVTFDDEGNAVVTLVGKGKFAGKYVCNGTRTNAVVTEDECGTSLDENSNTAASYIASLLAEESTEHNGLQEIIIDPSTPISTATPIQYFTDTINAGIRYVGSASEVKNKVYFNCDEIATTGESYGDENYDYASSCEVWRIIGVFDVEDGSGNTEKRMKIINTESTFKASWDSSSKNSGDGINQWGPSTLTDGSAYAGADLMQLLNGYYIGKSGSECKYNNTSGQDGFGQTCGTSALIYYKMKPLTSHALSMIEDAVWYTYGVSADTVTSSTATIAYLQERGITKKYTGCKDNESTTTTQCTTDNVTRDNEWTGLVGLMSVSDIGFANGWLYTSGTGVSNAWSISPLSYSYYASYVWYSSSSSAYNGGAYYSSGVWPAVYLSSNVQIIGGDGLNTPYKLSIQTENDQ